MSDQELLDQLDRDSAPGWRPEPGDTIIGTAVSVTMRDPMNGYDHYPVLTIRKDDGTEVAVHAFHHVLRSHLEGLRPKAGQRIAIKYAGERQGAERTYRDYRVSVERAEGEDFDWGAAPPAAPSGPGSGGAEPLTDADRAAVAAAQPPSPPARPLPDEGDIPF